MLLQILSASAVCCAARLWGATFVVCVYLCAGAISAVQRAQREPQCACAVGVFAVQLLCCGMRVAFVAVALSLLQQQQKWCCGASARAARLLVLSLGVLCVFYHSVTVISGESAC